MRAQGLLHALAFGAVVLAAGATPAQGQTASYDALIAQAVEEFNAGHWSDARRLLRSAHAIEPSARTLRTIGLASFRLGDYADATRRLEQALVHPTRPLTEDLRRQVEGLLAAARLHVGRLRVRVLPAEAEWTVDGEAPLLEADGAVLLEVGRHTIAARARGYASASGETTIVGGDEHELSVTLEREARALPERLPAGAERTLAVELPTTRETAPAAISSTTAPPNPSAADRPFYSRWWFWGAAGAVVVGVAAAIVGPSLVAEADKRPFVGGVGGTHYTLGAEGAGSRW